MALMLVRLVVWAFNSEFISCLFHYLMQLVVLVHAELMKC